MRCGASTSLAPRRIVRVKSPGRASSNVCHTTARARPHAPVLLQMGCDSTLEPGVLLFAMGMSMRYSLLAVLFCVSGLLAQVTPNQAQQPNPTQQPGFVVEREPMPVYRVTVVSRTANAINYRHRSGATKIDFRGTALMPEARGEAKVESKQGYIEIEVEFDNINRPASTFGPEYLTYVMWAITPEGRASNLGEVILNRNKSKLNVTTELQSFGLILTAEPYFAVTQPSDVVVMENVVRADTRGKIDVIQANYELLQRGQYVMDRSHFRPVQVSSNVPLELLEARNAVEIARAAGADKYAADTFQKAVKALDQAEGYQVRKAGKRPVAMMSREAVQTAEDSRLIAIRRIQEERLAQEREAAAEREATAKAAAEEEARRRAEADAARLAETERARIEAERRAQAEADRLAAERARAEALQLKAEAEAAAERAVRERESAEAARAAALAQQQIAQSEAERARLAAAEADRLRQQAENDKAELRNRLLQQLNMILETRDSARGLIVNMSDVLFDFGKATLRPGAREKLAKIAGIVLAHPGLRLEIEGHTDSIGSDEFNQKLSEQRASVVREYLSSQGIPGESVMARGFGESRPVASNDNAAGRQQNRRVELVVSGELIGTEIGSAARSVQ
jgi:outer membrane protein OmpA-like peptidoglycan-associated protein